MHLICIQCISMVCSRGSPTGCRLSTDRKGECSTRRQRMRLRLQTNKRQVCLANHLQELTGIFTQTEVIGHCVHNSLDIIHYWCCKLHLKLCWMNVSEMLYLFYGVDSCVINFPVWFSLIGAFIFYIIFW